MAGIIVHLRRQTGTSAVLLGQQGLRVQVDAVHAQMPQVNNGMGAMMQTMMGVGGPPARPGG